MFNFVEIPKASVWIASSGSKLQALLFQKDRGNNDDKRLHELQKLLKRLDQIWNKNLTHNLMYRVQLNCSKKNIHKSSIKNNFQFSTNDLKCNYYSLCKSIDAHHEVSLIQILRRSNKAIPEHMSRVLRNSETNWQRKWKSISLGVWCSLTACQSLSPTFFFLS